LDQLTAASGSEPPFRPLLNPNSAVGYEVMSEEQTFRSEDNAFCL
jgi:hypothetical protein